jgi:hypothetical protein
MKPGIIINIMSSMENAHSHYYDIFTKVAGCVFSFYPSKDIEDKKNISAIVSSIDSELFQQLSIDKTKEIYISQDLSFISK